MANICSQNIVYYGDEAGVLRLYLWLREMESGKKTGMGDLLDAAGIKDWESMDVNARGSIQDVELLEATKESPMGVRVGVESKWTPSNDALDLVADAVCGVGDGVMKEVMVAEEPGCEIYVNTDTEGLFLKEMAVVETNDDTEYFYMGEDGDFLEYVERKTGVRCKNWDDFWGRYDGRYDSDGEGSEVFERGYRKTNGYLEDDEDACFTVHRYDGTY